MIIHRRVYNVLIKGKNQQQMEEWTLINEPYKFLFLFIIFIDRKIVIKTYIKCVFKHYNAYW